jgi:hypothetical protein
LIIFLKKNHKKKQKAKEKKRKEKKLMGLRKEKN